MPATQVNVTKGLFSAAATPVDVMERASPDIFTTITSDPTTGTSLAVAERARFPQAANFKVRVEAEVMLVTAGFGSGAGTFTVTRGQDGTANVAHTSGVTCSLVVGIQRVEPVAGAQQVSFRGRAATFRTPGRAGTTGQKIFAIHNATASAVNLDLDKVTVDVIQAAAAGQAPTVLSCIIRVWKFTAVPTNGTALGKVPEDSALTSKSTVTVWGDASSDGAGSVTTLTVTLPAGTFIAQEFCPRMLVVGTSASTIYEGFDRTTFLEEEGTSITLRALEGICVYLDYPLATANPTTNSYVVSMRWSEWSPA